jgi:hypothetical protein
VFQCSLNSSAMADTMINMRGLHSLRRDSISQSFSVGKINFSPK